MSQSTDITSTDPSNPPATYVNISCFDLLLIELVPLAERMARSYEASLDKPSLANRPYQNKHLLHSTTSASNTTTNPTTSSTTTTTANPNAGGPPSTAGMTATTTMQAPLAGDGLPETEVFKDSIHVRLERLGYRVGQGLTERFSRDKPRMTDSLDVIKFLCKDLWMVVFQKQIDNLKTNHRGVFVLTDNKFRPFARMSMASNAEAVLRAQPHLFFPCGIIRGVLASLGVNATVQAESTELPTATFQIKTIPVKA